MNANEATRRGDDGSEASTPDQDTAAAPILGEQTDTAPDPCAELIRAADAHLVVLELVVNPRDVGTRLQTLVDALLHPTSSAAVELGDLAEQLRSTDVLEQQLTAYAEERRRRQEAENAAVLDRFEHSCRKVLARVYDERYRHTDGGWDYLRFRHEWELYADDAGAVYPLPTNWYRSVDRLARDGAPWDVVRIQTHATLTGPGPRTFAAFIRSSRRTSRKMRAYAEHRAQAELPNVLRGPW